MKKTISWPVLILWIILTLALAAPMGVAESMGDLVFADEIAGIDVDLATLGIQRGTQVVVGSPIAMGGQFGTELWDNNTVDMDVRALLHGYQTVCWTRSQSLDMNHTVVTDVQTAQADDGTLTYTLQFADNLRYSDGSAITARDFAFCFLLSGAPQIKAVGGTTQGMSHIVGYDAYQSGETNVLNGVRVISDNILEIQVISDSFPYFYGLALINAKPYPISEIAPGCEVLDDGEGAYISGGFTAALLEQSLLNPETGYQYFPKVTSGPYTLEAYDRETNEAHFLVNEYFVGNYEGQKPHIERVVFRHVPEDEMLNAVVDGTIDLLNKVTDGNAQQQIQDMLAAQGDAQRTISQFSYLRTGFGFLAFACEESPTSSEAVRRAIAMSLDKDALIQETMANTALRAYGYYGLGQWMASYVDEGDEATGKAPLNIMEQLHTLDVPMDLHSAALLLASDGWTLNAQGNAYVSGQDTVRYRDDDGQLEPLTIRWAMTEDNQVAGYVKEMLAETLPGLGIDLQITEMPFPKMLEHYYRQTERGYNMFFMASNFTYIFDPYYDFSTSDAYQGVVNTTGLRNEQLIKLAGDMRETEPMDLRTYVEKWMVFQEKFVELMPMVPLYSNVYYDFFTDDLVNYDITGNAGWSYAITYAYLRNHDSITAS